MSQRLRNLPLWKQHLYSALFSVICMTLAMIIAHLYYNMVPENSTNIPLIFLFAIMIVARQTVGYLHGLGCCLFAVIWFNYRFTYPYFNLNFTLTGYPITFIVMAAISVFTCTMTANLAMKMDIIREREQELAEIEIEKMRANLLRAISHDLRTPLTGIIGNSSLYLERSNQLNEQEKTDLIENIYEDSNWLLNMVENLLTVTRIKGDNLSITTTEESVEEVIAASLQKLNKRYPNANIQVYFPDEFIIIPMDAILIQQVTINLVANAIEHSDSVAPVDLIVSTTPQAVTFTIRDYGIGLPAERLESLFDGSSYASHHSSDTYRGMGIGLSICKTIITAHGGTITGHNHSNGAEFIFTLPRNPRKFDPSTETTKE